MSTIGVGADCVVTHGVLCQPEHEGPEPACRGRANQSSRVEDLTGDSVWATRLCLPPHARISRIDCEQTEKVLHAANCHLPLWPQISEKGVSVAPLRTRLVCPLADDELRSRSCGVDDVLKLLYI